MQLEATGKVPCFEVPYILNNEVAIPSNLASMENAWTNSDIAAEFGISFHLQLYLVALPLLGCREDFNSQGHYGLDLTQVSSFERPIEFQINWPIENST